MTNSARKISIGKLSESTSVPIPTLRTWERRYNFPVSERTEGNHRLYDVSLVSHLRLVVQILAKGHRARQVLGLSIRELQTLMGETSPPTTDIHMSKKVNTDFEIFEIWLDDVRSLNTKACLGHFRLALSQLGLRQFILKRIIPFISKIGCAWHEGKLQIFQEHFVTRLLSQFLEEHWQLINASNNGRTVVISSHPLEKHTLGFHLIASMLVLEGFSVLVLGNNTPVDEIVACAEQTKAIAIALTFSITMSSTDVMHFLEELENHIIQYSTSQPLMIVGGGGTPKDAMNRWLVHQDVDTMGQVLRTHQG